MASVRWTAWNMLMILPNQVLTTNARRTARPGQGTKGFAPAGQAQKLASGNKGYLAGILIIAIYGFGSPTDAAEIAAFRTTNIDSQIELRYLSNERINSSAGVLASSEEQTNFEEEFSVQTQNYVFHPNFLKLDLGAGITFKQNSFETEFATNQDDNNSYNLNARAMFLEKKPYPVSFYYSRDNPTSFTGVAQLIEHENTRYGFDFALLEPLIPLKLTLFASHDEQSGGSPSQLTDESDDRFGIRASKEYSEYYSHRFNFDHVEEDSGSGSLALPITPTLLTTDLISYVSEWHPGENKNIRYYDRLSVTRHEGVVSSEEVRFVPKLTWRHSARAESFYFYDYLDMSQDNLNTTNRSASARFNYQYNEQTELQTEALVDDNSTTGVDIQSSGASGSVKYYRPIKNGKLTLGGGLDYSQSDRNATAAQANVIGETIILSGLTPVRLATEFIIPSSIVVQNLVRSQTYVDGIDYRMIVVGSRSEIHRLAGSNIGDPEQVVVDYAYQTGGSVSYSSLEWFYNIGLTLNQYDLYLRYRLNDQNLSTGSPTLPLYSKNTLLAGAGTEFLLGDRVEVGANVDLVRQREETSPYDSERYSAFGQFIIGNSTTLRLDASQTIVDNLNSVEDTDLANFSMILRSRLHNRMIVSVEAYNEKDTGGTVIRERDDFKLTAQWRIYRLTMNAHAIFGNDRTGTIETERARFMLTLRRDI